MITFIKTRWIEIKDQFTLQEKQTTCCPDSSDASKTIHESVYVPVPIDSNEASSSSSDPQCSVFTILIGLIDILMLITAYIIQDGTVLTSDTWIKMGCKYVPCMKPLSSKAEQEIYNSGLKSQCQAFLFPYQFFRFFTPIFLHSGITHLLNNLVYQALAGCLLKEKYDLKTLIFCYILFGFSGNILSAICNPKSISVGASGAVYGLLIFCSIDHTLRIFTIEDNHEKFIQFLITLLVIPYFILSLFFDVDFSGRTDHAAHIGGAIMGIFVSMYLCKLPEFLLMKLSNGERRIQLISMIFIFSYFILTLFIFYIFVPVHLK